MNIGMAESARLHLAPQISGAMTSPVGMPVNSASPIQPIATCKNVTATEQHQQCQAQRQGQHVVPSLTWWSFMAKLVGSRSAMSIVADWHGGRLYARVSSTPALLPWH